jgi:hypothetical protein
MVGSSFSVFRFSARRALKRKTEMLKYRAAAGGIWFKKVLPNYICSWFLRSASAKTMNNKKIKNHAAEGDHSVRETIANPRY